MHPTGFEPVLDQPLRDSIPFLITVTGAKGGANSMPQRVKSFFTLGIATVWVFFSVSGMVVESFFI